MAENNKIDGSKPLKGKREKFAQIIALGNKNQTEAAKEAGYKDNKAIRVNASRLLTFDNVKARIEYLRARLAEKWEITKDKVIALIDEAEQIARDKGDAANILRAAEMKGKTIGLFAERIIHEDKDELSQERIKQAKEQARQSAERECLRLVKHTG